MKVYLFFLYVPNKKKNDFPLVNRYRIVDKEILFDNKERFLYAYTTDKLLRDLFKKERNMKLFGAKPTKVTFHDMKAFEAFEKKYMGRELERRGVHDHKFTAIPKSCSVVGTSDEFDYVEYDWQNLFFPTVEEDLPISSIFKEKYRNALSTLHYPFETIYDYAEGMGWWSFETGYIVLDEFQLFMKFFGNLYAYKRR